MYSSFIHHSSAYRERDFENEENIETLDDDDDMIPSPVLVDGLGSDGPPKNHPPFPFGREKKKKRTFQLVFLDDDECWEGQSLVIDSPPYIPIFFFFFDHYPVASMLLFLAYDN